MYYQKFYDWCRMAVGKIAYPPDQNEVYSELYDHMMDRYEDFIAHGITEEMAVEMTLAAMGDPEELAPRLAALHKPYWAYAMILTRVLAAVLLVISVVYFAFFLNDQHYIGLNGEHMLYDPFEEETENRISYVVLDVEDSEDGYIFRIEKAAVWENRAVLRLRVTNPRPWALESKAPSYMWARDSNGVNYTYHAKSERKSSDTVFVDSEQTGLLTYDCNLYLYGDMQDVQWLELCYDRAGRDIRLWIDLTGGR